MTAFENATVLELGARGKLRGAAFALVGRTCVKSASGGVWNEWAARFDDGRVAFLAEARGTFTLFFERPLAGAWDALRIGAPLDTGFVVTERGQATRILRWGETFDAPKTYRYADLSSQTGETATIDYGEADPRTFVGTRVTLKSLGLKPRAERPSYVPVPVSAASRAPKGVELVLAIGDEGTIDGTKYRVLGVLHRSIRIEGERYTWEEYLLHEASAGFRWLVVSDGHWNLVDSVEAGLVTETERGATFEGEAYKPWSEGTAKVEWAAGELPWAVSIGDTSSVRDYVRAPYMLSFEGTDDEISWSRGTYMPPDAISRAFGKRVLPKPVGRAPNQPRNPSRR
jgi:Domain of unknown function (DUF4178)